jgi:hypothetical protein
MNRPPEYDERLRVKGFSILDDDFDFMAVDFCSDVEVKSNVNKICASVARLIKVVCTLWQNPARFNPGGAEV